MVWGGTVFQPNDIAVMYIENKRYYLRKKGQIPSANQVTKSKVMKTKFYLNSPMQGKEEEMS